MINDDRLVIVTGAMGFIGSSLINHLYDKENVIAVDLYESDTWHYIKNCKIYDFWHPQELIEKDSSWMQENVKHIYHLGAKTDWNIGISELIEWNTRFSIEILRKFNSLQTKIIYASDALVYGVNSKNHKESHRLNPANAYACSKAWIDQIITPDMWNVIGLRLYSVYGPNEYHLYSHASEFMQIYLQLIECDSVSLPKSNNALINDGYQSRDMIYIDDVVAAMCELANMPMDPEQEPNAIMLNLGSGKSVSLIELTKLIMKYSGIKSKIVFSDPLPNRMGLQNHCQANVENLNTYRIRARTSLDDGIQKYLRLWDENLYNIFCAW